mgnify:CR=1 FL=1
MGDLHKIFADNLFTPAPPLSKYTQIPPFSGRLLPENKKSCCSKPQHVVQECFYKILNLSPTSFAPNVKSLGNYLSKSPAMNMVKSNRRALTATAQWLSLRLYESATMERKK